MRKLQQQDVHISKIVTKFMSKKCDKTVYYLNEYGVAYREIKDGPNIFHAVMVPQTLQPYILPESHNALGHNGPTRLYNFIRRHYYWRKMHQHCNKYVRFWMSTGHIKGTSLC